MYNLNHQRIRTNNFNKKVYIAKKMETIVDDYGNEKVVYSKPKKYFFNIMPEKNTSTSSDIEAFGERLISSRVATIPYNQNNLNEFNEFDVAYLEGATPEGEVENGFNANYYIYAIQPQNAIIKIYFTKLVKNN